MSIAKHAGGSSASQTVRTGRSVTVLHGRPFVEPTPSSVWCQHEDLTSVSSCPLCPHVGSQPVDAPSAGSGKMVRPAKTKKSYKLSFRIVSRAES